MTEQNKQPKWEVKRDELANYAAELTNKDKEAVRHYTKYGYEQGYNAARADMQSELKRTNDNNKKQKLESFIDANATVFATGAAGALFTVWKDDYVTGANLLKPLVLKAFELIAECRNEDLDERPEMAQLISELESMMEGVHEKRKK